MIHYMLLDGTYPQDIRVRKESESLSEKGIKVCVITRWKKGLAKKEVVNGVLIVRIGINYSNNIKRLNYMLFSLFFIDFLFYFKLRSYIKKKNINLLHVHDLPLVKTAKICLPKTGKIILDMHENYPEMLEEFTYSDEGFLKSLINKCFFNVNHWKKYERKIISSVNHIIAVVDEMKEKIIAEYNYPSNCISVISNYEKIDFETGEKKDNFIFNPTVFYIAYVGGISPVRGLETVIEAVSLLKKEGKSVQFLIIGAGNERYVSNLKKAASHFKVDKEIHFLGYKKFNCINYYIKRVQLNIIPHIKNEHTDHTIPHKLFQIMLLRAPLIVSSCEPLIRYTKEYQAGNVFKAGNPENLAKTIISIQENPSLIQTQVENAYKLVKEKFNWESESEKLTTLIKSFYE